MAQTGKIEPKEVSRQNVKLAVQIFLRTVLAAILSFSCISPLQPLSTV